MSVDNTPEPDVVWDPSLKPGVYTSEFWLSMGTTVVAMLGAFGIGGAEEAVRAVFGGIAMIVPDVYSVVRSGLKRS